MDKKETINIKYGQHEMNIKKKLKNIMFCTKCNLNN